jgi:hypothetical protein
MHTEIKEQYDFSAPPPVPPPPHFDLASIEVAKPVEPLRKRLISQNPWRVLRFGAIAAGVMMMILGIATMARLNNQLNNQTKAAPSATPETIATADASQDASASVETESAPGAWSNTLPSVVRERRRHRAPRYLRAPREMFDLEQPPVNGMNGKPRARLVTVIQ